MNFKLLKSIVLPIFFFAFISSIQAKHSEVMVYNNTKSYLISGKLDVYQLDANIETKPRIVDIHYGYPIKPGQHGGYAAPVDSWIGWEGYTRLHNIKYSTLQLTIWNKNEHKSSGITKTITLSGSDNFLFDTLKTPVIARLESTNKRKVKIGIKAEDFFYYDYIITVSEH